MVLDKKTKNFVRSNTFVNSGSNADAYGSYRKI